MAITGFDVVDVIVKNFKNNPDQKVVVFTGSGVSAESGIPTFRDKFTGLWECYSVDDVASVDGFKANPKLVWKWHEWLRKLTLNSDPNRAHATIALMETLLPLTVITQNIDGLHQRAGSKNVIELHGSIHNHSCSECGVPHFLTDPINDCHPVCTVCGSLIRHDVVWFGESLANDSYSRAKTAVRNCTMMFVIGTSGQIYPAAIFPAEAAHRGAMVVQINPNAAEHDSVTPYRLRGTACEWVPVIANAVWPNLSLLGEEK